MATITNIIAIEDDIVARLESITGIQQIYREPLAEDVSDTNAKTPSIYIENIGFVPGQYKAQKQRITTLWRIGVLCPRNDYLMVGGDVFLQIMKKIIGHQPTTWMNEGRLGGGDKNEPMFLGKLAFYPAVYEIDIAINTQK